MKLSILFVGIALVIGSVSLGATPVVLIAFKIDIQRIRITDRPRDDERVVQCFLMNTSKEPIKILAGVKAPPSLMLAMEPMVFLAVGDKPTPLGVGARTGDSALNPILLQPGELAFLAEYRIPASRAPERQSVVYLPDRETAQRHGAWHDKVQGEVIDIEIAKELYLSLKEEVERNMLGNE